MKRRLLLLLFLLLLPACDQVSREMTYREAGQDTTSDPPSRRQLVERLHAEGLILDAEVQQVSSKRMAEVQQGEITAAEASLRLLDWLEEWERENPERAEVARAARARQLKEAGSEEVAVGGR